MEDHEKDIIVIGKPLYPDLTLERLREVVEEIFNKPKVKEQISWIERMYQNMSPENRKLFDESLRQHAGFKVLPKIHDIKTKPKYTNDVIPTPNYINGFNKQINKKPKVINKSTKKKKRKR